MDSTTMEPNQRINRPNYRRNNNNNRPRPGNSNLPPRFQNRQQQQQQQTLASGEDAPNAFIEESPISTVNNNNNNHQYGQRRQQNHYRNRNNFFKNRDYNRQNSGGRYTDNNNHDSDTRFTTHSASQNRPKTGENYDHQRYNGQQRESHQNAHRGTSNESGEHYSQDTQRQSTNNYNRRQNHSEYSEHNGNRNAPRMYRQTQDNNNNRNADQQDLSNSRQLYRTGAMNNSHVPSRRYQNTNDRNVRGLSHTFGRMAVSSSRRSNLNSRHLEFEQPDPSNDTDSDQCVDKSPNTNNASSQSRQRDPANSCPSSAIQSGDKPESQREIMDEQLRKEEYECLVCCEMVRGADRTWNCSNCFNVFHLNCINSWAQSLQTAKKEQDGNQRGRNSRRNQTGDWRCPTCQSIQKKMPNIYFCYCSKRRNPEISRYLVPHSCGDPCGRPLKLFNTSEIESDQYFSCPHKCTSLCHPGKCAPCQLKMERTCACKQTKMYLSCVSKKSLLECQRSCNKLLNCGRHRCEERCHFGDCRPCEQTFDIKCFCGNELRKEQICVAGLEMSFTCDAICGNKLACSNHFCQDTCHPGPCGECALLPKNVKTCNCGQTKLVDLKNSTRRSCLDPVPICSKVCNKPLKCGSESNPHLCLNLCHVGACPPCLKSSIIKCECGANSQKLDCKDMTGWRFKCKRRCNKKLQCGRHKCLQECCTIQQHICQQVCGKKLDCGTHYCEEPCHNYCQSCPNVIWEEIVCNCGSEVLYPPQPCGTKKPACNRVCSRPHPCGHAQQHTCHDDDECPPCVTMVSRRCIGNHEDVKNVYCYQTQPSCGKQCSRKLNCGMHRCVKSCHSGDCPPCNQKCTSVRDICQHPCALPCHQASAPSCPKSHCLEPVKVFCDCKFRQEIMACYQVYDPKRYQSLLEIMMKKYQFNSEMTYDTIRTMVNEKLLHYLECSDDCAKNKRTQQLAEAFGITPGDVIQESKYTEFLKNEARANPEFIDLVHEKCVNLITEFKKKNVRQLSYNFSPMSRVNRQIIHHYAESMGLKTESIDQEPNRSVMIKATKLSMIPARSLLQVLGIEFKKLAKPKEFVVTAKTASEEQSMKKKVVIDYFND